MTQPPPPTAYTEHQSIFSPVLITGREIYDLLMHLSTQVSSIQQQLTQRTVDDKERDERVDARFRDHEKRADDHELRLRAQEKTRWPLPSIAALTAVVAVIVAIYYH